MTTPCQTTSSTTSRFANAKVQFAGGRSKGSGACQSKGKKNTRGILPHICKSNWKNKTPNERIVNDTIKKQL
jgi:hypothetical protein